MTTGLFNIFISYEKENIISIPDKFTWFDDGYYRTVHIKIEEQVPRTVPCGTP